MTSAMTSAAGSCWFISPALPARIPGWREPATRPDLPQTGASFCRDWPRFGQPDRQV